MSKKHSCGTGGSPVLPGRSPGSRKPSLRPGWTGEAPVRRARFLKPRQQLEYPIQSPQPMRKASQNLRDAAALRMSLLSWYDRNRRDLPWRRTCDPYRIWVSEIMLQQTRVAVVIPRYQRFLRKFPSVQKLASAREISVLAEWS